MTEILIAAIFCSLGMIILMATFGGILLLLSRSAKEIANPSPHSGFDVDQ